jgi:Raf kinase inhibitor-like YbhB/YbcL family protein
MRIRASLLLAAPALLLAAGMVYAQGGMGGGGMQGQGGGAPQNPPPPPLTMTSTAFTDGQMLPVQYTCSAKPAAISPPLAWTNVPKGTASFTIILHDLEPRARKGIEDNLHWMIWNIPGTTTSMPENVPPSAAELPDGSRQSQPGAQTPGFRGPCPPMNVSLIHHYTFELFALDQKLDVPAGATRDDVYKAMDGHVLGHAVLVSVYHR